MNRDTEAAKEVTKTVMGWIREHKIPRWGESTNIIAAIIAKHRVDEVIIPRWQFEEIIATERTRGAKEAFALLKEVKDAK